MRILVAVVTLLFASKATALTCVVPPLEERYREHVHVALVQVVVARLEESEGFPAASPFPQDAIEISVETKRRAPAWRRIATTVRVLESYKGAAPPTELSLTSWNHHPQIITGGTYLVFLNGPEVSIDCDGMRLVSAGNPQDVRAVNRLRALKQNAFRQRGKLKPNNSSKPTPLRGAA